MKRAIAFLLCLVMLASLGGTAFAERPLEWSLSKKGVLTISGDGELPDYSYTAPPWENKRKEIKAIVVEEGVTGISANTFQYCVNAKTAVLPDSLTYLGDYAFYKCRALESVVMPETLDVLGANCFDECHKLKSLTIPYGLEEIPDALCGNCKALKSVTIPDTVEHVGYSAFAGCSALKDVYYEGAQEDWEYIEIESGNKNLQNASFRCEGNPWYADEDRIAALEWSISKKGVLTISGDGMMPDYSHVESPWAKQSKEIKSVVIEDGITSISENAFQFCGNLKTISIPDSVKEIGNAAFYKCYNLKEIELPEGIEIIGEETFNCCESLKTVYIPASVTEIGNSAFNACYHIETVYYGGSADEWEDIEISGYNKRLLDASIKCLG